MLTKEKELNTLNESLRGLNKYVIKIKINDMQEASGDIKSIFKSQLES